MEMAIPLLLWNPISSRLLPGTTPPLVLQPGIRQGEKSAYFGAFITDGDGNKIEAAAFPKRA